MNNRGAYMDPEGYLLRLSYIDPADREGVFVYCGGCRTARPLTALVQLMWMSGTHEVTCWICEGYDGLGVPECIAQAAQAISEMYAERGVPIGMRN